MAISIRPPKSARALQAIPANTENLRFLCTSPPYPPAWHCDWSNCPRTDVTDSDFETAAQRFVEDILDTRTEWGTDITEDEAEIFKVRVLDGKSLQERVLDVYVSYAPTITVFRSNDT